MEPKSNIIDLKLRRRAKGAKSNTSSEQTTTAPVVDMTERRAEILQQERRRVKRTILTEFIGAFVVVPQKGLKRVSLYDISEKGISFDIDTDSGQFNLGEEVAMRVYMNQQTYFPFFITIQNIRSIADEGVVRHGGSFLQGSMNEEALYHFVRFIETVSASLEKDTGDVMVSNLSNR